MIVPPAMMRPSFMSTLPLTRCPRIATMDFPTMCARSVPTTQFIGSPATNNPGPAIKLPPTPKNPPKIPTTNPRIARYKGLMCCPEMGKSIQPPSVHPRFDTLQKCCGDDLEHHTLSRNQPPCHERVNQLVLIENLF